MDKFIQIGENVYNIAENEHLWKVFIYDYPKEYSKNSKEGHWVFAETIERARYLMDDAYSKYKDKEIKFYSATILLENIVTKEEVVKRFDSIEEERDFISGHQRLSFDAQKIIESVRMNKNLDNIHHSINIQTEVLKYKG